MANFIRALRSGVGAIALVLAPLAATAAEPPPLDAYGSLPDIEQMALSESGTRIAAIMTIRGQRKLLVMTNMFDQLQEIQLRDEKVRDLEWVGDERLIAVVSQTSTLGPEFLQSKIEFFHAIVVPATPSVEHKIVFEGDATMLNMVFGEYGVRKVDGRWLAYFAGTEKDRGARGYQLVNTAPALFAVDVEAHNWRRVADRPSQGEAHRWLVDADGKIAATLEAQFPSGRWTIKARGGTVLARGDDPRANVSLMSLGRNGTTVIYSERKAGDDFTRLFEVALDGQSDPVEFMKAEEAELLYYHRTTGHLLGFLRTGPRQVPEFFDPATQAKVRKIYGAFPNLEVSLIDWTPDFSHVLVKTAGNQDSGTWYLIDIAKMSAGAVGYERLAIEPQHVGKISTFAYKAGDGIDLDGILTLPPDREAKGLPMVVLPHGGPHSHDEATFDWWAQAFASRGYAVFQPNFRGSTNRDEAFMRAGYGQWGKKMQTDISDGVAELARQGIVDAKRVCIMGASYGGYAALAGVTLQNGIYRCAVSVAGVSDLEMLYSEEQKGGSSRFLRADLKEEFGEPNTLQAISPRSAAARADAPILLIHGRDDIVVPFRHSSEMAEALKNARKPYEMIELKAEDHWLSRAETRKQMLTAATAFVLEHNPPN